MVRRIEWAGAELFNTISGLSYGNLSTLGRLGTKEEPAGKIRVFAMVDAWTQWILRPIHDAIFFMLKRCPQDGTFDQPRPAQELAERLQSLLTSRKSGDPQVYVYSIDLSAATDRLPVSIQVPLVALVLAKLSFGYYAEQAPRLAEL